MARETWWDKHDFQVFTVFDAATALAWGVEVSGKSIRESFNDSPMVAYVGDTAEVIVMRWHYERLLFQIQRNIVDINDIALERMPDAG